MHPRHEALEPIRLWCLNGAMQRFEEQLRAPELRGLSWPQGTAHPLASLRGQIVLLDFWDFACINCLHTLPYLKEWHRRYTDLGLVILGIHTPEFPFAEAAERVLAAARELDLPYPIALDNEYLTWKSYANKAWPTHILIDAEGFMHARQVGEGGYAELETAIQDLLQARHPDWSPPLRMAPVRPLDAEGAVCVPITPELYCGHARGQVGNDEKLIPGRIIDFQLPNGELQADQLYLQGPWRIGPDFFESVADKAIGPSLIHLQCTAAGVNVVLDPGDNGPIPVQLQHAESPLGGVSNEVIRASQNTPAESVIVVERAGMVQWIRSGLGVQSHRLCLSASQAGLKVYAFTFTGC